MIEIIDTGGFEKEALALTSLQLSYPTPIKVTLSTSGHSVHSTLGDFSLNFYDRQYQSLISDKHPLLSAIGKKHHTVLDACAGLGKDGFILAHQQFDVLSCEASPILYLLLAQAVHNYCRTNPLKWSTYQGLAQDKLQNTTFDIVYLDPMFTVSRGAKPKLSMQIIQTLANHSPFEDWEQALACAKYRLVIKQHQKSPPITTLPTPSFQVHGKRSVRYDVYLKNP